MNTQIEPEIKFEWAHSYKINLHCTTPNFGIYKLLNLSSEFTIIPLIGTDGNVISP